MRAMRVMRMLLRVSYGVSDITTVIGVIRINERDVYMLKLIKGTFTKPKKLGIEEARWVLIGSSGCDGMSSW